MAPLRSSCKLATLCSSSLSSSLVCRKNFCVTRSCSCKYLAWLSASASLFSTFSAASDFSFPISAATSASFRSFSARCRSSFTAFSASATASSFSLTSPSCTLSSLTFSFTCSRVLFKTLSSRDKFLTSDIEPLFVTTPEALATAVDVLRRDCAPGPWMTVALARTVTAGTPAVPVKFCMTVCGPSSFACCGAPEEAFDCLASSRMACAEITCMARTATAKREPIEEKWQPYAILRGSCIGTGHVCARAKKA
mmetsp:Transcript_126532/g.352551  ORF Transcript_126532/g.352551 Transcript_126532/m.352551 type:complete len:252 (+) Transcript_126532:400-1155(+)